MTTKSEEERKKQQTLGLSVLNGKRKGQDRKQQQGEEGMLLVNV